MSELQISIPKLYPLTDVSKLTGLSAEYLRRLANAKRIPSIKRLNRHYLTEAEVVFVANGGRLTPAPKDAQ